MAIMLRLFHGLFILFHEGREKWILSRWYIMNYRNSISILNYLDALILFSDRIAYKRGNKSHERRDA